MSWFSVEAPSLSDQQIQEVVTRTIAEAHKRICGTFNRVLLLPPDLTRAHSRVGYVTELFYKALMAENPKCDIHVIPTLGQHVPHTEEENKWMFGSIPNERIHAHDWRHGVVRVGKIPAEKVKETTG